MAFRWNSVGHFFASVVTDIVKGAKVLVTIGQKVESAAPVIESISDVVYPGASAIERAAFAILGEVISVIQAAEGAPAVAGSTGSAITISLDTATVADLRALLPSIEQYIKMLGIVKPSTRQTVTGK